MIYRRKAEIIITIDDERVQEEKEYKAADNNATESDRCI
jgi:hypothetical protein